jgi:hypothetical protein
MYIRRVRAYATLRKGKRFHCIMNLAGGDFEKTCEDGYGKYFEMYAVPTSRMWILHVFEYMCGWLPYTVPGGMIKYVNYKKLLYPLNIALLYFIIT